MCFPFPALSQHSPSPQLCQALIIYIWQKTPPRPTGAVAGWRQLLQQVFGTAWSCSHPTAQPAPGSPPAPNPAPSPSRPQPPRASPDDGTERFPPRLSPQGSAAGAAGSPGRQPATAFPCLLLTLRLFPFPDQQSHGGKSPSGASRATDAPHGEGTPRRPPAQGLLPTVPAPAAKPAPGEEPRAASRSSCSSGKGTDRYPAGGQSPRTEGEPREPSSDGRSKRFHFDYKSQIALVSFPPHPPRSTRPWAPNPSHQLLCLPLRLEQIFYARLYNIFFMIQSATGFPK